MGIKTIKEHKGEKQHLSHKGGSGKQLSPMITCKGYHTFKENG